MIMIILFNNLKLSKNRFSAISKLIRKLFLKSINILNFNHATLLIDRY